MCTSGMSQFVCAHLGCLSLYVHICECLSLYVHICECLSLYVHICECLNSCVHICECFSLCVLCVFVSYFLVLIGKCLSINRLIFS